MNVALNPNTNLIYVANEWNDNLSVIDGASNTVVATVPVGSCPQEHRRQPPDEAHLRGEPRKTTQYRLLSTSPRQPRRQRPPPPRRSHLP